jgi:hypothetical protein
MKYAFFLSIVLFSVSASADIEGSDFGTSPRTLFGPSKLGTTISNCLKNHPGKLTFCIDQSSQLEDGKRPETTTVDFAEVQEGTPGQN